MVFYQINKMDAGWRTKAQERFLVIDYADNQECLKVVKFFASILKNKGFIINVTAKDNNGKWHSIN